MITNETLTSTERPAAPAEHSNGAEALPMPAVTQQPALGRRLKALRVSRGLSLKDVAAATGLSASFVSMVETGQNEMTVGRLVTLAEFYEVGISDLISERARERPVVLRRDDRQRTETADQRVRSESLAAWHHGDMVGEFLHFDQGAELPQITPQAGAEFVLVLDGEIEIEFADEASLLLREGDSVWFEASRKHRHVNVGTRQANVLTFKGSTRND
jgi:transcriptional regulator with XRE-family HTH domain